MTGLASLFPAADYQFRMTMRRDRPEEFFLPRNAELLRERARWVGEDPKRYALLQPEFGHLLAEASRLGESWGLPTVADVSEMATRWEPDVLLLSREPAGQFRLRGGALCFPTAWALEEKLGLGLGEIHDGVPGLNPAIGRAIDQFMEGLSSGAAFHRENWGLAASNELNLHPARGLPPPLPPVNLGEIWLRVEHQAFVALPETRGIMFGIRIAMHRLDEVARDAAAAAGLVRALQTMPPAMARYKRVDAVRGPLIAVLAGQAT